mgnify:CR=1 FL=1
MGAIAYPPDGVPDIHFVLSNINADQQVTMIDVTDDMGGVWHGSLVDGEWKSNGLNYNAYLFGTGADRDLYFSTFWQNSNIY